VNSRIEYMFEYTRIFTDEISEIRCQAYDHRISIGNKVLKIYVYGSMKKSGNISFDEAPKNWILV